MVQLISLPSQNSIISCLIFTFLVPAYPGCPEKEAVKMSVVIRVGRVRDRVNDRVALG